MVGWKLGGGKALSLRFWLACALLLTLPSCAAESYYSYRGSHPERIKPYKIRDGAITLTLPELDVSIQAQNVVMKSANLAFIPVAAIDTLSSRLPLWVEIAPHGQPVRFDLSALDVVDVEGHAHEPMGFWGPGVGDYKAGFIPRAISGLGFPSHPSCVKPKGR